MIISLRQRRLFLTTGDGRAISYPVAVGKAGKAWAGSARIDGKYVNPAWVPPAVVRAAVRGLPPIIPGGAPNNPMGRARHARPRRIAIHGTTRRCAPPSAGPPLSAASACYNEDIVDLYDG